MTPFQMGDYRCLKVIRGLVQAATGPETSSDELDCLNRLMFGFACSALITVIGGGWLAYHLYMALALYFGA